ncbi:NADH-ubiquinone oxidoreductase chain 3 [Golovinomyces cichoracearum]|uniref:NADH-ubiquinone oxidoreductase chain 3 n=1 Tax=Golovinomyces cichoracearum TaxID=62708 RepID=A0A420HDW4_9PEZI|nr:NADH-ubiquinone oxidoreductase chain 3 [Golovinomyces cichoracearum]
MTSQTFFLIFIPILAIILLAVNLIFAPHNPYEEKDSAFECGFHSFLGQNRSEFSISFFIFALLFLLFDLEILLVYPYVVSAYANGIFGLIIMLVFFLVLTLGFAFELGKNALSIENYVTYIKLYYLYLGELNLTVKYVTFNRSNMSSNLIALIIL